MRAPRAKILFFTSKYVFLSSIILFLKVTGWQLCIACGLQSTISRSTQTFTFFSFAFQTQASQQVECVSAQMYKQSMGAEYELAVGNYTARVRAISLAGEGPWTEPVRFDVPEETISEYSTWWSNIRSGDNCTPANCPYLIGTVSILTPPPKKKKRQRKEKFYHVSLFLHKIVYSNV